MFSSIDRYAARFGIDDDDFDLMVRVVRALDAERAEFLAQREKSKG